MAPKGRRNTSRVKSGGDGLKSSSKKMTDKEQSERFKETARKLEVDETGKALDTAFRAIVGKKERS